MTAEVLEIFRVSWPLFSGVLLAFLLWVLICNDRTLKQRLAIIKLVYEYDPDPEAWVPLKKLRGGFAGVSFFEHVWANVRFMDYKKLYPTIFAAELGAKE